MTSKSAFKSRVNTHHGLTILFSILLTFSSCSKKIDDGDQIGDLTTLTVEVGGLSLPEEGSKTKTKSMSITPQQTHNGEDILQKRLLQDGDFHMRLVAAESSDKSFANSKSYSSRPFELIKQASASRSTLNPLAADIQMNPGVKYVFILQNTTTRGLEHVVLGESNKQLLLDIVKGQEYNWYAYSYNNEDDIPLPNRSTPQAQTYTDKPLLYASGRAKRTGIGNENVKITFKHQLKKVQVHIDTRGIFGDILSHAAQFEESDYIKTGTFNLLDGTFSNLTTVPVTTLNMVDAIQGLPQVKIDQYYSADVTRNTYKVKVTDLTVSQPDGTTKDLLQNFPGGREETYAFSADGRGKIHSAQIDIWRNITTKRILHLEYDEDFSFTASKTNRASGAFFQHRGNFGREDTCHMRIQDMIHILRTKPLNNVIENELEGSSSSAPDVVIMTSTASYSTADYEAIVRYLKRGGAVLLMANDDFGDRIQNTLFKGIFPNSPNLTADELDGTGSVYKLKDVDPHILTWPFGDVRQQRWGGQSPNTLYLQNLSPTDLNDIVVYTAGAVNRTEHRPEAISMFRHKTLNFFFVGDQAFLANRFPDFTNPGQNATENPFLLDSKKFPAARTRYGRTPEPGSLEVGLWNVHNSTLFGNIISWLLMRSQFQGLQ